MNESRMNRRNFLCTVGMGLACLTLQAYADDNVSITADKTAKRPNIVFILVDDMGWMDIGANGSRFYETPNVDKLAGEGMRFTQAYAASPICSPTRASILTHSQRDNKLELYNIKADIGETNNLADDLPQLRDSLLGMLYGWWDDVDARFPRGYARLPDIPIKKAPFLPQ